mmetsp:Transcript_15532/g.45926  ORF Transcript_15532/g.45926 Transcript_15532/m.45926 type:complete len:226 (-) Transcript_15532:377-1054(-)
MDHLHMLVHPFSYNGSGLVRPPSPFPSHGVLVVAPAEDALVRTRKRRSCFHALVRGDAVKGVLVAAPPAAKLVLGPATQFDSAVRANDLVPLLREGLALERCHHLWTRGRIRGCQRTRDGIHVGRGRSHGAPKVLEVYHALDLSGGAGGLRSGLLQGLGVRSIRVHRDVEHELIDHVFRHADHSLCRSIRCASLATHRALHFNALWLDLVHGTLGALLPRWGAVP